MFLAQYFGVDPETVWIWPGGKRRLWGRIVSKVVHQERRITAVEYARANAYAMFEPKQLVKLLNIDGDTDRAEKPRSATLDAIAKAEAIIRMPGSGSIHDPLREDVT